MNEKIKVILVIVVFLALIATVNPIYGQENSSTEKFSAGYFIGGVGWMLETGHGSIVYSTGGGGHSITNRWLVGGEGHGSFGPENAGGYGFFNVGYLLVKEDSVMLYPMLGLGGGSMTDEVKSDVSNCALLKPSFGIDFLIPMKGASGVLLGARGGFTFTIHHDNTFNWSMPHIHLLIGGYGFEE